MPSTEIGGSGNIVDLSEDGAWAIALKGPAHPSAVAVVEVKAEAPAAEVVASAAEVVVPAAEVVAPAVKVDVPGAEVAPQSLARAESRAAVPTIAPPGGLLADRQWGGATGRTLRQAGLMERLLAVVTLLVLYHETPNAWLLGLGDRPDDYSNPLTVVVQLGLVSLAFSRIGGSIDHLIGLFRLEPTVFLFTGLVLASTMWSADPAVSMRRGVMFTSVTLFASYLVLRFSLQEIIALLATMFVVSGVINLTVILVWPDVAIDRLGRFDGVFAQKNALGYVSAMAIPTLLVAARSWRRWRLLCYGAVALHAYLLVGSESKTMLVACVASVALMIAYVAFRGRRTLPGIVAVSLVGSSVFALAFVTANIALLAKWLDKDVSLSGRVPLWEGLLPVVSERLVLGHGFEAAFSGAFSPAHEVVVQVGWNPGDSHNAGMQILLELGLVGLLLFLIGYGRGVVRAVRIAVIVPGAIGLWPLVLMTMALLISVTETGVQSDSMGWVMYLVAVLTASGHLQYRSQVGLSNALDPSIRFVHDNDLMARRLPSIPRAKVVVAPSDAPEPVGSPGAATLANGMSSRCGCGKGSSCRCLAGPNKKPAGHAEVEVESSRSEPDPVATG